MANKEFNLSVLENATTFSTPLKECFDYQAIFSLIKEEVDIAQTEDEMEYQKAEKSPETKRKVSESHSSESVFKSPYKKTNRSKLKGPGVLLVAQQRKWFETTKNNARDKRARSLGRAKPGRSSLTNRRRRTSVSHSEISTCLYSEDDSTAEIPKKTLGNGNLAQSAEERCRKYKMLLNFQEATIDSSNADDENSISSKGESTSLATTDPLDVGTADENFVESSQSTTTSSELRQRLSLRRRLAEINPTITDIVKEGSRKNSVESDEDNQNFSLTLSPESKSSARTGKKEASSSPPRLKKRKAVCRVNPLKGPTRELDNSNDKGPAGEAPLQKRTRKISVDSPLKGLTQELEICMRKEDYVTMCDSETETMSFTFETIQLLNEYEDCNEQANSKILDKILSSSMKPPEEETRAVVDNVACNESEPIKDPLYIDDNVTNEDVPPSTSKRKESAAKKPKVSKRKSTVTKTPKRGEKRKSEDSLHADKTDMDADLLPATSKRKSSTTKTPIRPNETSTPVATSSRDKRRFSSRLKSKEPVNMHIPDSDGDDGMSAEAAKLAEKVAAAKKNAALSAEILNKLNNLVVRLRHDVPPQHKIESHAGSSALSYREQKQFLEYAPLNKRTYSPAEDEIIKKNWNDFCEDHDWEPDDYKPFLLFKHGERLIMSSLEERRKFVQFLANGLPNRPLCSVYSRFKRLYNKYDALGSRYTKEEDTKIIAYMKYHSIESPESQCSELAKVMNRSRTSIWKRYAKLVKKNCPIERKKRVLTKVEWDLQIVEEFITALLDVTLSDELIELKDAFLPRVIWLKMEEKIKISYEVMQRFWDRQLHLQLFAPEPISMNEIKIKLIEYMHMEKIIHSKKIRWNAVAKYFDGYTIPFLRYVFNHLTMKASVALQTRDFSKILQWLHDKKINELRFTLNDKCLPRISYKDKKAELVAEDLARVRLVSEESDDD